MGGFLITRTLLTDHFVVATPRRLRAVAGREAVCAATATGVCGWPALSLVSDGVTGDVGGR